MSSLGFGIDVALKERRTGASGPPAAAITSLQVLPAAGLTGVDGSDAADANGWVAKAVLADDGVSSFDPAKIVLTVDPGFDAAGNPTTVTRTIAGTAVLRKQNPNGSSRLNSAVGGVRTVYFALADDVYAGSTVTAAAMPGYYGAAAAGGIASVINGSTRPYPKPLFAWMNTQHERATGSSYAVEAVAFHRHGMNGRQVACVQYYATDGQVAPNQSATVTAALPQLSAIQTQGQIAEVYTGAIPLAALTQADLCRVNARVYPWLGDSSAVLDLFADGVAPTGGCTTMSPQTPLRFVCDKSGGYGGLNAYVRAGGTATTAAAGCFAGAQTSTALSNAQCFSTVQAAIAALASAGGNGSRPNGHTNHSGGTIYGCEATPGAGASHVIGASSGTASGLCWTDIKVDPLATGAVSFALSANASQCSMLRWQAPVVVSGGFQMNGGGGSAMMALENMTLSYSAASSVPINYQFGLTFLKNMTLTGGANAASPFFGFSTSRTQMRAVGVVFTDIAGPSSANAVPVQPFTLIGCRLANCHPTDGTWVSGGAWDSLDGAIVYNNQLLKLQNACVFASGDMTAGYSRGIAIVQNIFERTNTANIPCLMIGGDDAVQPFDNVIDFHNSIPGAATAGSSIARTNRCYADVAGSAGVLKRVTSRFNLWHDYNVKTDTFTAKTSVSGRTGNWRVRYNAGNRGNVAVLGGDDGAVAADASGASWLGEYWPADGKPGGASVAFASNSAGPVGGGGGSYTLTGGGNDAYARVASAGASGISIGGAPVSLALLRYDQAGTARKADGMGAAGAFERTDI